MIAVMLLAVPAAAKKPPPNDHGFPLDKYIHDVIAGKFFIGGNPPKILGAKTKDAVFVLDGKAHYQPQLGFRRVGRDNGHGKFLVLKARSWASALAYVVGLDPSVARYIHTFFPQALFSRRFPPLYAQITYKFEIAPNSATPQFEKVPVASEPHPDPALRKRGVALVTSKRGVTPGTYLVRVSVQVGLAAHPLKKLYEAYDAATGAIGWLSLVGKPAEVVLEKAVEATIAKLVERAAKGDQAAIKVLSGPAYREKIAKKKLENWIKSALTETGTTAKIEVPTLVPDLTTLNRPRALRKLQERFLRYTWINDGSRSCGKGPGQVKSQSVKPGTKVKVGTRIRVRVCTKPAPAPRPTPKPGTGSLTWARTGIVLNPAKASPRPKVKVGLTQTHIDYDFTEAPQTEFDIDIAGPPPASVKPGAPYQFGVKVSGKITGGKDTQGFRTADAIPIIEGRWDGHTAVGTGQNCNDPIGAAPISCTQPSQNTGAFTITFPIPSKRGDTFAFGITLLNCAACYIEYRYTAR